MTQLQATPADLLNRLIAGHTRTQMVYVAAKLDLAGVLRDGPLPGEAVARAVGAHPDALHRLMRALVVLGLLTEEADGRFGLTAAGALLRGDVPGSVRGRAILSGESSREAWGALLHTVRTGETAFDAVFGTHSFAYYARDPETSRAFNASMAARARAEGEAVPAAYDFSGVRTLVDVGGGNGSMLAGILRACPHLHGVVFDAPHVVAEAAPVLAAAGVADRCGTAGGDFFRAVPDGGDAYLLSRIVHDWDDERAVAILRNIAGVLPPDGRVLLLETVLPERVGTPQGEPPVYHPVLLDVTMLVVTGGRERTPSGYAALFGAAGLRLSGVTPVPGAGEWGTHVIEARRVG